MSAPACTRRAAAALFFKRQRLDRPRGRRFTAAAVESFVADACGLQIDSVNVVERAHLLTLWSRFGTFDRAAFERLAYRRRALFEYLSHVACFVAARDLPVWRAAMDGAPERFRRRHRYPGRQQAAVDAVEREVRERGPLGNSHFERPAGTTGGGWWTWKPATHALDFLWKSGRIAVHSRRHFQKLYAGMERVLPDAEQVAPISPAEFTRERIRRSLAAMGVAPLADLKGYWTWPGLPTADLRAALAALVREGEVTEVRVEGQQAPEFVRTADLPALLAAARARRPARGTTLLCPFDSFLWNRDRVLRLLGFHYRIEIYVPRTLRSHGYYTLPILHEGQLIGRLDPKTDRASGTLLVHHVAFEPWFARGARPPAADWGTPDRAAAIAGLAGALRDLARFVGTPRIRLGRVSPGALRAPIAAALRG